MELPKETWSDYLQVRQPPSQEDKNFSKEQISDFPRRNQVFNVRGLY